MANSKIYLEVPYAQKDAAKALGARWDANNKKWYAPANIDIAPFAKWHTQTVALTLPSKKPNSLRAQAAPSLNSRSATNAPSGAITYSSIKNFIPYSGDVPPWD